MYAQDKIFVKYAPPGLDCTARADTRAQYVEETLAEYTLVPGLQVVALKGGVTVEEAIAYFSARPDVEYAEPVYYTSAACVPNDPLYNADPAGLLPSVWNLWNLNNTGDFKLLDGEQIYSAVAGADARLEGAWNYTTGSSDVIVAVLDTGVNYNHEDIKDNMWTNASDGSHGYDFVNFDNDPMDDQGHGSHCAGIAGAVGNNSAGITGAAWNVSIMAVKTMDENGSGDAAKIIAGIEYAVFNGADILSMSFVDFWYSHAAYDAVKAAGEAGVLTVAAAGNFGMDIDNVPMSPAAYSHSLSSVVSVAATSHRDTKTSFSNYGVQNVTVAAPGLEILSLNHSSDTEYLYISGTSQAAPLVSGIAALMLSANESLSPAEIRDILRDTSDEKPDLDAVSASHGRVNATAAVMAAVRAGDTCREVRTSADLRTGIIAANGRPDTLYTLVIADDIRVEGELPAIAGNVALTPARDKDISLSLSDSGGGRLYAGGGILTLRDNGSGVLTLQGCPENRNSLVFVNCGGVFVMDGGNLTGNSARSGGAVFVGDEGSFVMRNGTITKNTAEFGGGVYTSGLFTMSGGNITKNSAGKSHGGVSNHGEFTLSGGTISGNTAAASIAGVFNDGLFTMTGGDISSNTADWVGGVYNNITGVFTMTGGEISGNTAADSYGGVYNFGTFTMYDGAVSGNAAGNYTGGVSNMGIFTLFGGSITGNTAGKSDGGVYNSKDGQFTIAGGEISACSAEIGGGVSNHGGFAMTGGNITGCSAELGGGVFNYGGFTMTGGEISASSAKWGGGVYSQGNSSFTLSGTAKVADDNEVFLADSHLTLTAPLENGGGAYNITSARASGLINPLACLVVRGAGAVPSADNFTLRYAPAGSLALHEGDLKIIGVTNVSLAGMQTVNITSFTKTFNESVIPLSKSGYTFLGWGESGIPVIDSAGRLIANVANFSNETGFWVHPFANTMLSPVWQSTGGGGSTDTGSGHYAEYPRSVTDGGKVSFGSSPLVTEVDLPAGVHGEVILVAESSVPAPEGKKTAKVFEINIPSYPSGTPAEVEFKLTAKEIEAAGYAPADVCLYHCGADGVWEKLPTSYTIKDGVVYYSAVTTAFSPFAIVYEEGAASLSQAEPEPAPVPVVTQSATQVATAAETLPPASAAPAATAAAQSPAGFAGLVFGLAAVGYLCRRKDA